MKRELDAVLDGLHGQGVRSDVLAAMNRERPHDEPATDPLRPAATGQPKVLHQCSARDESGRNCARPKRPPMPLVANRLMGVAGIRRQRWRRFAERGTQHLPSPGRAAGVRTGPLCQAWREAARCARPSTAAAGGGGRCRQPFTRLPLLPEGRACRQRRACRRTCGVHPAGHGPADAWSSPRARTRPPVSCRRATTCGAPETRCVPRDPDGEWRRSLRSVLWPCKG